LKRAFTGPPAFLDQLGGKLKHWPIPLDQKAEGLRIGLDAAIE
jgi:hypothetical protein